MANLRITDLTPILAVNPDDVFPVVNSSFFNNYSTTAQISAGAVATSIGKFLSVPVYNPTLSSFQPLVNKNTVTGNAASVFGGVNNTASGNYSAIVGGQSNTTNSQTNTFILGSNISAPVPNYTFVNNLSSQGQVYAAALHGDGSAITNLPVSVYKTAGSTPTLSTSIIPGGFGRNTASSGYSFIAGGSGNYTSYPNTFILGSGLSASQANTTYVNNLTAQGVISTSAVFITQPVIVTGNALPLTIALSAQGSVFNQIQNLAPTVSASTDLVLTNDQGLAYLDIGITSTQYNGNAVTPAFTVTQPSDSYIYAVGGNLDIGTANSNNINFFTNGTLSGNTVVVITSTGYVGINTTNPIVPLTVNGILSTNNIHYASGGNSNLWNSGYTNLTANSANWQNTYTTVTANSGNWNSAYQSLSTNPYILNQTLSSTSTLIGSNTANNTFSEVLGGQCNLASGVYSTIVNGFSSCATGYATFVGAGSGIRATGDYAVAVGGICNTASGCYSNVAGGQCNNASGNCSNVAGGQCNNASACASNVAGGIKNTASGNCSNVAGGWGNKASGNNSNVAGGRSNTASANCSNIAGGWCNTTSGVYSFIAGGSANDTKGFANTFILGTALSALSANYTYVNNIEVANTPSSIIMKDTSGVRWKITVSTGGALVVAAA